MEDGDFVDLCFLKLILQIYIIVMFVEDRSHSRVPEINKKIERKYDDIKALQISYDGKCAILRRNMRNSNSSISERQI